MKKVKFLMLIFVMIMMIGVTSVEAAEYSDEFKKITTDGTLTLNAMTPKSLEDAEFLLTASVRDLVDTTKYQAYGGCIETVYNCEVQINLIGDYENYESHSVIVTYNEPSESLKNKVNSVANNMRIFEHSPENPFTPERGYILDDLYLINYLNTSTEFELWNMDAPSRAIRFSKELISLTSGSNITFKMDVRAGEELDVYQFAFGQAILYYDGIAFTTKNAAITQINILYIPDETADTQEAYITAAKNRIDSYLGTNDISVAYGGLKTSLDPYNFENDIIDYSITDENYYNITILGRTYKFLIAKKTTSQLELPKYVGSDVASNVLITSDESIVPLDSLLSIQNVNSDSIRNLLNTNNYLAYDFGLYSQNKKANITRLDNGTFQVKIPISDTTLEGKTIVVYYLTSENKLEEHTATVSDGFAVFETNHFSTYIVAEKVGEANPQTYDGITTYFILGIVSLISLSGASWYLRKRFN